MTQISRSSRTLSRRGLLTGGAALATLAACGNPVGNFNAERLDSRVDATRDYLRQNHPELDTLFQDAQGILYMPLVTEAGLFIGGSFGQGALRINDATVDYYSATRLSAGLQIGAQQYAHVLFFMTPQALADFRAGEGWAASADIRYATPTQGGSAGVQTTTLFAPVIAVVFGQAGLIAGASLAGVRYQRIIP
ncbi:MAG: twin-arginine translocation pathway signal [Rhodobacter sp.]|uniref:lipid-binding SYLF domain-containing protein n=1 Tax=Pararhodobacter sp. TaxID=2127056 RepID=UPI001D217ABA|nr:YSC84-related protein [Pararhodobacter sp.]MCB1344269.1 twin-arginine translocation pathway signal [Paracoccaceae bacterium]MCC0074248.1 twin-arginine translocation pathway signal [Rhodobacter sp.]HPD93196.1 YSC84-related protein [Pararhodobacter sp.]